MSRQSSTIPSEVPRTPLAALLLGLLAAPAQAPGRTVERADIIVAKDGSGRFNTVQAAVDSVPEGSLRTWIILIRRGTYNEKVSVTQNNIALVGEDRDSTRIVYAELRRIWRETHSNDWGAAVVNVGKNVLGFTLANLTVWNNYGSLYGDHDHQFAVRSAGNATKIIIVACNLIADGGDAVSLWNTESGMYYHADCTFSGYVDYVCPRSSCYITDSRFFGYSTTASIWHDGSSDSTSKFVIRNSSFDGIPGFALGRNHRDAQFYLLGCRFSKNLADRPIYRAAPGASYRWAERSYYRDCHRDGGDYTWFRDNLDRLSDGEVTAFWTFRGLWDPERTMSAVLPWASIPAPGDGAPGVTTGDSLRWIGGRNAIAYRVHLGTADPPDFLSEQPGTSYHPASLGRGTTYYWRIDVVTDAGRIKGPLWKFTTAQASPRGGSRDSGIQRAGSGPKAHSTAERGSDR